MMYQEDILVRTLVTIFRHKCTIKPKARKMEKWSFDPVEGPIRRYTVNEEVIIIQDEFVNPNNCGNCKILEDKIRSLEASLTQEKRNTEIIKAEYSKFISLSEKQQAELTRNHQNLLSKIYKRVMEDRKKLETILARLRE